MIIRKIESTNAADVKAFIRFPFHLYKNSPFWVPPFIADMKKVMDRANYPYYRHSDADFFVAEQDGEVVGRVAMLEKKKFNEYRNSKTAFFYLFESMDDKDVVTALFQKAEIWARERGLNKILGPFGFIQGDSHGILVEGNDRRPALGQNYNYKYYDDLLFHAGFSKLTDYYSGYLPGTHQLSQRFFDIADKVSKKRGFWIKSFEHKKELGEWIERIQILYNKTFSENISYSPMDLEEAKIVADQLLAISNPKLIKLVMKGEEIIGFLFAFADITDGLRKANGKMWPFGVYHIMRDFKKTEWCNFNGTGLLPGHRGVGANAVLYTEMARTIQKFGFKHADVVQIEEKNIKSMGDMTAIGVEWYKKHRVYEKMLS